MVDFGEPVLRAILAAAHREHVGHVPGSRTIGVTWRVAKLDAVVGQDRMDLIGNGGNKGDEEVELFLGALNLADIDVEEANRVGFESLLRFLVALDLR